MDQYKPKSKLWNIYQYIDGNYDVGKYHMGKAKATVIDCDGDGTEWLFWIDGKLIAEGKVSPHFSYHDFFEGIRQVELLLIQHGYLV